MDIPMGLFLYTAIAYFWLFATGVAFLHYLPQQRRVEYILFVYTHIGVSVGFGDILLFVCIS